MTEYAGLSIRDIYRLKCEELGVKKNSTLMKELPAVPDQFDEPTKLDMSKNFVGVKGLSALLEVVKVARRLTHLGLRDNQLTNQAVLEMAEVLQCHRTLRSIDLSDNPITIAAGKSLLDLARQNHRIEEISVAGTQIRDMLLRAIEAQLQKNRAHNRHDEERKDIAVMPEGQAVTSELDTGALRNVLSDISTSIHDSLFDEEPAERVGDACLKFSALFKDPTFPPESASVQRVILKDYGVAKWVRASELVPTRRLFTDGSSVADVDLGRSSSAWLFQAIASMQEAGGRLESLFHPKQWSSFGCYSVRLFIDGRWRHVLVDDYFPVDSEDKPVFAHTRADAPSSLWPMLLEKAFAKVQGSYQSLDDSVGTTHPLEKPHSCATAMTDVTGGVGISRDVHQDAFDADEWWHELLDLHVRGALIAATTSARDKAAVEEAGLTPHSAYTVQAVRAINGFRLLRLRNPFQQHVWAGEWSDNSVLWEQYPDIKTALDVKNKSDGSFWIPYPAFLRYFQAVHIAKTFERWNSAMLVGEWESKSAGGPCFEESWMHNPRYKLSVQRPGKVFINLSVPDTRFSVQVADTIAFHVIKSSYFPMRYEKDNVVVKTSYLITHSVSFEGELDAGVYWIVPSTYTAGRESSFKIKVFAEAPFTLLHEHEESYWRGITLKSNWASSGEYQGGEDHPQFELKIPAHPDPARVLLSLTVEESEEFCIVLFVCSGGSGRILGPIEDDRVLAKSKFLISKTVQLQCELPGGDQPYVIIPCLQPEGSRSSCTLKCWCSLPRFSISELPMWGRKHVKGEWEHSSTYQSAEGNPQFELVCPIPLERFVAKLEVQGQPDPSIILFVVDNNGRQGKGIRGIIPESKMVCASTYIRAEAVAKDFQLPAQPSDSYLLIPNLQPPGCRGSCTLTLSCPGADFQLHSILD